MAVRIVDPKRAAAPKGARGSKAATSAKPPAPRKGAPGPGKPGRPSGKPGAPKDGLGPQIPEPKPPTGDTESTGDRLSQLVSDPKVWWGVGIAVGGFLAWMLVQKLMGTGAGSSSGSSSGGSGSGGGGGGGNPPPGPGPGPGPGPAPGPGSSVGGGGGGGGSVGGGGGGPQMVLQSPASQTRLAAALSAATSGTARGGTVRRAVGHHAVLNAGQVNPTARYIKATGSTHYAPQIRNVRPGFGGSHAAVHAKPATRGQQARATLTHGGPPGRVRPPAPKVGPKKKYTPPPQLRGFRP